VDGRAVLALSERNEIRRGPCGGVRQGFALSNPVKLRRCEAGEQGVVISPPNRVSGYEAVAIPLITYLYAVDSGEARYRRRFR